MIRFARFNQWFCAVFCLYDFGLMTWQAVDARWGWAAYLLANAAVMAFLWRVNGRNRERIESIQLERELWQ